MKRENFIKKVFAVKRENFIKNPKKTKPFWILIVVTFFSTFSLSSFADELKHSKIAGALEQKLLIKNDVIESVSVGVLQLGKACNFEKNKNENNLEIQNQLFENIEARFENLNQFIQDIELSISKIRKDALQIVRSNCGILGQFIGNGQTDKKLCENTKEKIKFIDRLQPSLEKNKNLGKLQFSTLSTLFDIQTMQCTTQNFSEKIYKETQSVLMPLDASIKNELLEALKLIE